jgi:hypothetical protein
VCVVADENGTPYPDKEIVQINLSKNRQIMVVQALANDTGEIGIMEGF